MLKNHYDDPLYDVKLMRVKRDEYQTVRPLS